MSKRDNPRLKASAEKSGKNKRAAHSVQKDGKLGASKEQSFKKSGAFKDKLGRRSGASKEQSFKRGGAYRSERQSFSSVSGEKQGRGYAKKAALAAAGFRARTDERFSHAGHEAVNPKLIIGRNPVMEALKAGRSIDKILMQKDAEGSAKKIASLARESKVVLQYVDKIALDKLAPGRPHQGVAAFAAAKEYSSIEAMLALAKSRGEEPLIVVLDGLEDPHNLGTVLRSCDGAGAHGVVIPARRAVGLTETVAKSSAGAIEYVPVAKVTNLARCIDELKEKGLWIASVDMDGENYSEAKLSGALALVVGGEGQGVSEILRKNSDYIVSIPMKGKVNSLNASNAAAVMLYEVNRQRSKK